MDEKLQSFVTSFNAQSDVLKQAKLLETFYRDHFVTLKRIAEELNVQPSYLSQLRKVLDLPALVIDGYYNKSISATHLLLLSRLSDAESINDAYKYLLAHDLSTLDFEKYIRQKKHDIETKGDYLSSEEIEHVKEKILKVVPEAEIEVTQSRIKGSIQITIPGDTETTSKKIVELMNSFANPFHEEETASLDQGDL